MALPIACTMVIRHEEGATGQDGPGWQVPWSTACTQPGRVLRWVAELTWAVQVVGRAQLNAGDLLQSIVLRLRDRVSGLVGGGMLGRRVHKRTCRFFRKMWGCVRDVDVVDSV